MKKILSTLIVAFLCLSLSLIFISCSKEEENEEAAVTEQETTQVQDEAVDAGGEMKEETGQMAEQTSQETQEAAGETQGQANGMAEDSMQVAEAAQKGDPAKGKETYNQLCASCHGTGGKGDGPAAAALDPKPRDHTDAEYMSSISNDYMFKVISQGGASVGKSQLMPAWGGTLSEQDIWNVIAYIRQDLCKCQYKGK